MVDSTTLLMWGSWVRAPAGVQIASIVQLVERLTVNQEVVGAGPAGSALNFSVGV